MSEISRGPAKCSLWQARLKKPHFHPEGMLDISREQAERSARKARFEKAVFHPEGTAGY